MINSTRIGTVAILLLGIGIGHFLNPVQEAQAQSWDSPSHSQMSAYDLRSITSAGGGVVVDANALSAYDLRSIVSASTPKSFVIIKNANAISAYDCRSISSAATGYVIFDF